MSSGKSFLNKEELPFEERLGELERKMPTLNDKIQSYDTLFDMNEKNKKSMDFLSNQIVSLEKKLEYQKKEQQQQLNDVMDVCSRLSNTVESSSSKCSQYKSESDEKHKALNDTQMMHIRYLDFVKKFMEDITSKMTSKQDLDEFKKLNNESIESIKNRIDSFSATNQNIRQSHQTLLEKFSDIEIFVKNEIFSLNGYVKQIKDIQSLDRSTIESVNENQIPSLRNEMSTVLDQVKKLIPDVLLHVDSIKQDIQDKMYHVELDGKNSILRTTNNERSVEMMKKQIENIYLLLKKQELSQRG